MSARIYQLPLIQYYFETKIKKFFLVDVVTFLFILFIHFKVSMYRHFLWKAKKRCAFILFKCFGFTWINYFNEKHFTNLIYVIFNYYRIQK